MKPILAAKTCGVLVHSSLGGPPHEELLMLEGPLITTSVNQPKKERVIFEKKLNKGRQVKSK